MAATWAKSLTRVSLAKLPISASEGLVVLVRHTDEIARVQTHGRQCQIWSLEEVAKIVRLHPLVVQVKTHFPGATIEKTRPGRDVLQARADDLASLPFWGADP